MVRDAGGTLLLRIEDTDAGRCKPEYEAAIFADLKWLGLNWQEPVWRQSSRLAEYDITLNRLIDAGFCYPCSCTRKDIRDALSAPQEGQKTATDGPVYPGTCRHRHMDTRGENDAIRLDIAKVLKQYPGIADLTFNETGPKFTGLHPLTTDRLLNQIGDIVLARRDINTASYHLSVVVDDAAQGITDIIRGEDLFESTYIHRLLQALLDLPTPTYHHHRLIRDEDGKRLAKRDDARAIHTYRDKGLSVADIRKLVGL